MMVGTHSLPLVPASAFHAGDFNSQHKDWCYRQTSSHGETQCQQDSSNNTLLVVDLKEPPGFFSARWNTHTNADLAFAARQQ